jgi:tRNA(Ile)-lysidine synthase
MPVLEKVRRFAVRHALWRPETRVVAAVSGGSDSVAMLCLLHDLHVGGELRLAGVAHLNHQIRPEADDDEAFCRALADRLGTPFVSARVDVPARARDQRQSLEIAGRIARRRFLDEVLRDLPADVAATAHTEDDQAETVLLRLMRGSGQRGLAGIAPSTGSRIRPVLAVSRQTLRAELTARGETWREDATNADLANPRNRVRHELLPYLTTHFNPSAVRGLARAADVARAEDELLERMAAAAAVVLVQRDGRTVSLDADELRAAPEAIRRRVVRQVLASVQRRAPSFDDVRRVIEQMEPFRGKRVLVHDVSAPFSFELPVPGKVRTGSGWEIEATSFDRPQDLERRSDTAQIDAATLTGGLTVRGRQPGDWVRPLGLGGRGKKLQDVLVDRKVPRHERDSVPVLSDASGRIVWVAGHVLGEEFRVTASTNAVIILKLRRI